MTKHWWRFTDIYQSTSVMITIFFFILFRVFFVNEINKISTCGKVIAKKCLSGIYKKSEIDIWKGFGILHTENMYEIDAPDGVIIHLFV